MAEFIKHERGESHVEDAGQDETMTMRRGSEAACRDWTPEEEKLILRKLDFRVFPMLCIVFGLSLLDRTNISFAYIAGMGEDLDLEVGARYNIALLLFFIPYFLFEVPSNWVIRRVGSRIWMSLLITCWGVSLLGMGFIRNWQSLAGLRVALGFFEAGLLPGAIFILGCWYRPYESASRISGFWMSSQLFAAFGPILAYCFSLISVGDGIYAQGWRWILIIEGLFTIVAGSVSPFFLIEFPERAGFLNEREKYVALERVRLENERRDIHHPTAKETLVMLADWKIGLYCVLYFIAASSIYSLAFFSPIILLDGLGFDYAKAQLLSTPPYIFSIIASIFMAWVSDRIRMRWPIIILQAVLGIAGLLIILYGHPPGVRYFGLFLASYGIQSNVPSILSYVQNQTGRLEKKGIASAAVISAGALGGICGSTIFRSQDAPRYLPGMWSTITMQILFIIIVACLTIYFKKKNRMADQGRLRELEKVEGFRYSP